MNNEGINNSTKSSSGSSQENDYLPVQSGEASGKGKKRHSYSISTKLEAIAYAESTARKPQHENFVWAQREFENGAKRKRSLRLQRTQGKDYTAVVESLFPLSLRIECSSGSTI